MADINVGAGLLDPTSYDALIDAAIGATAGSVAVASYAAHIQSALDVNAAGSVAVQAYNPSLNIETGLTATAGAVAVASYAANVNAKTEFTAALGGVAVASYNAPFINSAIEVNRIFGGPSAVAVASSNPAVAVATQPGYFTVRMGICDENGDNKQYQRAWVNPSGQVWFTMNTADIDSPLSSSSVYCYLDMATDGWWYVDDAQLEFDTTDDTPGDWRHARGSTNVQSADERAMTVRKVCPCCREQVQRFSETKGRPRQDVEPEIDSDIQEV